MPVNTNGQVRMHLGQAHEVAVAERLERRGWAVQAWGQGLIREEIRAVLMAIWPPVLWRWLPDLIVTKGRVAVLVDPKSSIRADTPNFAIEQHAVVAHQLMAVLGLPIVYVFGDFTCARVQDIDIVYQSLNEPGRVQTGGSGTPYVLVRKADQRPLDVIFGPEKES
jgi:hypothetical protein